MPTWPVDLPTYTRIVGFQTNQYGQMVESDGALNGVTQRRERANGQVQRRKVLYVFSNQNYRDFLSFLQTDLKNGTIDFTWFDQLSAANVKARIVSQTVDVTPTNYNVISVGFTVEFV